MVRHTTTLAVLAAALWSAGCSVHISTGPSSPGYANGPARPNPIVWTTAPRPHREHRDPTPSDPSATPNDQSDQKPRKERPNRQFDAADDMLADAAAGRTPRQLEPTKDRGVAPIATPSHTDRKPRDVGHGVKSPNADQNSDEGPQMGGGQGDSRKKNQGTWARRLPRGDSGLQRVSKHDRDPDAQPAGPSEGR